MRLILFSLLLSILLTNCPTGDSQLADMEATVNPAVAGTVNPPRGTYRPGKEITIETEPVSDLWKFKGWSGDTISTDDSLTFTITKNMKLVANYETTLLAEGFSHHITVTDGLNSKDLYFGMKTLATAGFDIGIDQELPPRPLPGSFYRRFNIPDYGLLKDYRAIQDQETIWEMECAPDSGRVITINWDFSEASHNRTLTLTDDPKNPSFEVDMKSSTSYEVSNQSENILYIVSN